MASLLNDWLKHRLPESAQRRSFNWICALLAFVGTASAAFPVTAVVLPAAALAPNRWRQVSIFSATGSTLGATVLIALFHFYGWAQLFHYSPDLIAQVTWARVMAWVTEYGMLALFMVAASPLPQTPALLFFAIARPDFALIFLAILSGKLIKYGALAWLMARFSRRFDL